MEKTYDWFQKLKQNYLEKVSKKIILSKKWSLKNQKPT